MPHGFRTKNRHLYVRDHVGDSSMSIPAQIPPDEIKRIASDPQGFGELTEPYRRELQIHCYRILGSLQEAEDVVQETYIKAWKHIGTYEGRASFRSWLYKIATNTCLDFLDSKRSRRLLPFQTGPASDPHAPIVPPTPELTWLEPFPDEWLADTAAVNPEARYSQSESISLSFLTAVQVLPARQRAVLILRDVLDFSAIETAEVLELTVSSVNGALNRARKTLSKRYQGRVPETTRFSLADEKSKQLLDHYIQAWQAADVNGLVTLLKQDAILAMPPSPSWYQGNYSIGQFLAATVLGEGAMFAGKAKDRWRLLPTRANGTSAFGMYQRDETKRYLAFGLQVLIWEGNKIAQLTNFINPLLPSQFSLPTML
jgi:RNA polymerase sigma-70 factor, ECF subfamily